MKFYVVYFEPEDWVAFRETRRFGPSDRVQSVSLPTPFPFYGAVRTALLKRWGVKLELGKFPELDDEKRQIIGGPEDPGRIRLFGPFIFQRTSQGMEHYFPAPRNVYKCGDKYKIMPVLNEGTERLPWIPEFAGAVKVEAQYIEVSEIEKLRSKKDFKLSKTNCYEVELRLGIGLEKGLKRAEERMIYTMSVYRFKNGGFFMLSDEKTCEYLCDLNGVFLGAKQRWARIWIEEFKKADIFQPLEGKVAVWLLTPGVFDCGLVPKTRKFENANILAVAGSKKTVISGWDVSSNRSKTILHAAGVGTVYYLDQQISSFTLKESKFEEFGFGMMTFMNWDYFDWEE